MCRINKLSSHGVVLPIILWLLMFFMSLIVSFTSSINMGISTVSNIKEKFYSRQAMESSVYEVLYGLSSKPDMHRYGFYETESYDSSGRNINVEVVPEYMKMNINSISEEEIERLIRLYMFEKTENYLSTLQSLRSAIIYDNKQEASVDRRYVSIEDINRRGYRSGMHESMSKYFTVFAGGQRNIYSIYPSLSSTYAANDGDNVVYAVVTGAASQPYMIVEWSIE